VRTNIELLIAEFEPVECVDDEVGEKAVEGEVDEYLI